MFTVMGAVLGFQNCSEVDRKPFALVSNLGTGYFFCPQVVACRTGRLAADKLPGAALAVTMLETFVPRGVFF